MDQIVHLLFTRLVPEVSVEESFLALFVQCEEVDLGTAILAIVLTLGLEVQNFFAELEQLLLAFLVESLHVIHKHLH